VTQDEEEDSWDPDSWDPSVTGIDIEVNTRAKLIQPHKFDTFKISIMPEITMLTVREEIFRMIHSDKDYNMDVLQRCTFKTQNGTNLIWAHDQMRLDVFMKYLGHKPPLILNMVLDGYGEGGGKRAIRGEMNNIDNE